MIDFVYKPIQDMRARDAEAAEKAAVDARNAEIMKAADFLQPTKDLWTGFRGIKWGADIGSCPDMDVFKDHGDGLIEYTRKDDIGATLAGVPIDKILYSFYKGRFGWSTFFPRDDENLNEYDLTLREILAARYDSTFYDASAARGVSEFNGRKTYQLTTPSQYTHKDVFIRYAGKWNFGYYAGLKYEATYFEIMYLPIAKQKDKDDETIRKAAEQIQRDKLKDATKSSF